MYRYVHSASSSTAWFLPNRPIVLLGSGLETGHPDQARPCHVQLCYAENSEARSSYHPLQFSCPLFLQESFFFWGFLDFSIGQWLFLFFFRKSCATGGQTLRRLDSRSTCTANRMRSHWRTQKKPTLQEKSRKLAYWQDRTLSRRKSLSYEHEQGCRSSTSPGCDQLSPSCSPVAQTEQPLLFIYLFEMSQEKSKKRWWTWVWFLCRFCKWCACLVWIDWRTLSRSVAIHSPPICARCHRASKITARDLHFFFRFFFYFLFFIFFLLKCQGEKGQRKK